MHPTQDTTEQTSTSSISERKACRICGSKLRYVLDLGSIYPSNFVDEDIGEPQPLCLMECVNGGCKTIQLQHTLDMDSMYRQYWYRSGLNPTMVNALQDVVDKSMDRVMLGSNDLVIDIGCNDGTMLNMYPPYIITVGFDPARNLAEMAGPRCSIFINDYFGLRELSKHIGNQPAKIVTCIAMFYDLDDPLWFLWQVHRILDPEGILVIQLGDLMSMIRQTAFDNICHEHLIFYSFEGLKRILDQSGFHVFDVEWNDVNGGSVRVYAAKSSNMAPPIRPTIKDAIWAEKIFLKNDNIQDFAQRVDITKEVIVSYLKGSKANKLRTHILGASTKGNTLLQMFGIDDSLVEAAAEINPEKYGKKTIGTHIPIIPEEESMASQPDQYLVLPWHFIDGFVERKWEYLAGGGQFIVPLPEPMLINAQFGAIRRLSIIDFLNLYGDTVWREWMGEPLG